MGWDLKYVIEPDYSRNVLLELQAKYKLDTNLAMWFFNEGIDLPIVDKDDLKYWLHRYKMFIAADGDLTELYEVSTWDEELQEGQTVKEEVAETSSFTVCLFFFTCYCKCTWLANYLFNFHAFCRME